jgi:hypothetical protein
MIYVLPIVSGTLFAKHVIPRFKDIRSYEKAAATAAS